MSGRRGPSRVALYSIDIGDIRSPGVHLVTFDEAGESDPVEAARAWLQVRGYQRATRAVDDSAAMIAQGPAAGGYHVMINKSHRLLMLIRWPEFDPHVFARQVPELDWLVS